ncbi:hypothetical protein EIP91_005294 [Steccherinum ochraceum]|uniref:TLC domain-containing protein n=1 Tax=Steccherinum ochraceum TaxID=92696 RepID=A0A4R0RIE3_9APHY|nr:hypothetical protein EIP91_005294 [Steccherinum ochraceum]
MANDLLRQSDAFFRSLAQPIADQFGLKHLPDHFSTLAYTAFFYTFLHIVVAPTLSPIVAPVSYAKLKGRRGRNNWHIHLVSFVNAILLSYLSFISLHHPELEEDKTFGWHESIGVLDAVAVGYFFWEFVDAVWNYTDFGFVLHGLICTILYTMTFRPFLGYYSPRFLLWELSTPFLNIHWLLDKLDLTGSIYQYVNGILLLGVFFGVRLVYGIWMSSEFFVTLFNVRNEINTFYLVALAIGNTVLNGLNIFWFYKMIATLRKRFEVDVAPKLTDAEPKKVQ